MRPIPLYPSRLRFSAAYRTTEDGEYTGVYLKINRCVYSAPANAQVNLLVLEAKMKWRNLITWICTLACGTMLFVADKNSAPLSKTYDVPIDQRPFQRCTSMPPYRNRAFRDQSNRRGQRAHSFRAIPTNLSSLTGPPSRISLRRVRNGCLVR